MAGDDGAAHGDGGAAACGPPACEPMTGEVVTHGSPRALRFRGGKKEEKEEVGD